MFNGNETKIIAVIITRIVRKWHPTFGAILGFIIGFCNCRLIDSKDIVYYRNFYILLTECKFNDIYQDYGHLYN